MVEAFLGCLVLFACPFSLQSGETEAGVTWGSWQGGGGSSRGGGGGSGSAPHGGVVLWGTGDTTGGGRTPCPRAPPLPLSQRGARSPLCCAGHMEGGGQKSGACPRPGHCGAAVRALITPDLADDRLALPAPGLRRKLGACPGSFPVPGRWGVCARVRVCTDSSPTYPP